MFKMQSTTYCKCDARAMGVGQTRKKHTLCRQGLNRGNTSAYRNLRVDNTGGRSTHGLRRVSMQTGLSTPSVCTKTWSFLAAAWLTEGNCQPEPYRDTKPCSCHVRGTEACMPHISGLGVQRTSLVGSPSYRCMYPETLIGVDVYLKLVFGKTNVCYKFEWGLRLLCEYKWKNASKVRSQKPATGLPSP